MAAPARDLPLEIARDAADAVHRAAARIAARARAAVRRRGRFALALSGGETGAALAHALASADLPWRAVWLFQVDERVAPAGSPERNWTAQARLPLCDAQREPMPVELPDLDAAAAAYARRLGALTGYPPVLDLVHLGLGADGHTASLVPGDAVLEVRDRDVAPTAAPYQGHRRLTLTYPALERAREVLWLVAGRAKRDALAGLLRGDPGLPAARVCRARASLIAAADAAPK